MLNIIKEVRDLSRFRQILKVLFDEGFDFVLEKINLKKHVPIAERIKSKLKKPEKTRNEIRLRRVLEKLGPTFIKFGQVLSVRPDLIPKEYCKELEKLQDDVPPMPWIEVRRIVEKEFGMPIDRIFRKFETNPIASASISQVHKAVLKNNDIVAVKVQRPNAKKTMETDIDIMIYIASLLEKGMENIRKYKPVKVVEEFRTWTEKELDFRLEARNAKKFYENFRNSRHVKIPKVYSEFTTDKVLTLEYIDGIELNDFERIRKNNVNFKRMIGIGLEALLEQVFVHGIFHADPHPGNILIVDNDMVAFVDFGIVGFFDERLKQKCIDLVAGIVNQDEELILETLTSLGMSDTGNYDELRSDISSIISPLKGASLKDIKLSKVLEEILDLALQHNLKVPASLVLFGKTIITLEGVAIKYDPDFKIVESVEPFIRKLMLKQKNPFSQLKGISHNIRRYKHLFEDFPYRAEKILSRLESGSVKVDIEDTGIRKLSLEIDRSSNRITYGLMISAFLIVAALLINVQLGPKLLGISIFSLASFIFASIMTLVLIVSIITEKFRRF